MTATTTVHETIQDMSEIIEVAKARHGEDFAQRVHLMAALIMATKLYASAAVGVTNNKDDIVSQLTLNMAADKLTEMHMVLEDMLFSEDTLQEATQMIEKIITIADPAKKD